MIEWESSISPDKMTERQMKSKDQLLRFEEASRIAKGYVMAEVDPPFAEVKFINDFIGYGVFATQDLCRGDFILEYKGDLITLEEAKQREKQYDSENKGSFIVYFRTSSGKHMCVDATNFSSMGRFVNDGCGADRSCDLKVVPCEAISHVCLFALRDIKKGEELKFDYGVPDLPWRKNRQAKGKGLSLSSSRVGKLKSQDKIKRKTSEKDKKSCTSFDKCGTKSHNSGDKDKNEQSQEETLFDKEKRDEGSSVKESQHLTFEERKFKRGSAWKKPEECKEVSMKSRSRRDRDGTPGSNNTTQASSQSKKIPCGGCPGCQQKDNCRNCRHCKDMKKYGGRGVIKKKCLARQCHRRNTYNLMSTSQRSMIVVSSSEFGEADIIEYVSSPTSGLRMESAIHCPVETNGETSAGSVKTLKAKKQSVLNIETKKSRKRLEYLLKSPAIPKKPRTPSKNNKIFKSSQEARNVQETSNPEIRVYDFADDDIELERLSLELTLDTKTADKEASSISEPLGERLSCTSVQTSSNNEDMNMNDISTPKKGTTSKIVDDELESNPESNNKDDGSDHTTENQNHDGQQDTTSRSSEGHGVSPSCNDKSMTESQQKIHKRKGGCVLEKNRVGKCKGKHKKKKNLKMSRLSELTLMSVTVHNATTESETTFSHTAIQVSETGPSTPEKEKTMECGARESEVNQAVGSQRCADTNDFRKSRDNYSGSSLKSQTSQGSNQSDKEPATTCQENIVKDAVSGDISEQMEDASTLPTEDVSPAVSENRLPKLLVDDTAWFEEEMTVVGDKPDYNVEISSQNDMSHLTQRKYTQNLKQSTNKDSQNSQIELTQTKDLKSSSNESKKHTKKKKKVIQFDLKEKENKELKNLSDSKKRKRKASCIPGGAKKKRKISNIPNLPEVEEICESSKNSTCSLNTTCFNKSVENSSEKSTDTENRFALALKKVLKFLEQSLKKVEAGETPTRKKLAKKLGHKLNKLEQLLCKDSSSTVTFDETHCYPQRRKLGGHGTARMLRTLYQTLVSQTAECVQEKLNESSYEIQVTFKQNGTSVDDIDEDEEEDLLQCETQVDQDLVSTQPEMWKDISVTVRYTAGPGEQVEESNGAKTDEHVENVVQFLKTKIIQIEEGEKSMKKILTKTVKKMKKMLTEIQT